MAHELEMLKDGSYSFASTQKEWHGLGLKVEQAMTSEEALAAANLDWTVSKRVLMTGGQPVGTHMAVCRDTDDSILGIVGAKYKPLQNRDSFGLMDDLVSDGSMRYEAAGSLRGGSRIFLTGKIGSNEIVPNDRVDDYIVLYNTHDGSSALRVLWTQTRVVCANTVAMALSDAKKADGIAIRHTVNMGSRVNQAREVLGLAAAYNTAVVERQRYLATKSMSDAAVLRFLEELLPDREIEADSRQNNTRRDNIRKDILDLYTGDGMGSEMAGVAGTAWGAFNAVTEYTNHHSKVKRDSSEFRVESVLFGTGADMNRNAMRLLLATA
jgi:phage/plasmid-like protein (TIGR03299 family)